MLHYSRLFDSFNFYPVGFETVSSWVPSAILLVNLLGGRLKEKTGDSRLLSFRNSALVLEVQRGNAVAVFSTIPSPRSLEELFFLDEAVNVCLF